MGPVRIVNKFGKKCKTCAKWTEPGKGVAQREEYGWVVYCREHCGETDGLFNPWRHQHMAAEMDYVVGEYTAAAARARVNAEFQGTDALAEECPTCDGTCWWRATTLSRQCPDCRTQIVYRWNKVEERMERRVIK
jgi:predicted RNA-binding Zn-ribbon protein involved in translation (DUF1610 family)